MSISQPECKCGQCPAKPTRWGPSDRIPVCHCEPKQFCIFHYSMFHGNCPQCIQERIVERLLSIEKHLMMVLGSTGATTALSDAVSGSLPRGTHPDGSPVGWTDPAP